MILRYVHSLRTSGSTLKKKLPGTRCVLFKSLRTEITSNDMTLQVLMHVLLEEQENAIIIMSDQVQFQEVNKQNLSYWDGDNPQIIHKKPLHSPCVTA